MPRALRKALRQCGQRVVRVDSSGWRVKLRLIIITSVSYRRVFGMEKAHCRGSEESRWWALKFCFKFFQPICPRPPLDLEYTSVSGDLHPTPHWLLQPPRLLYDRAASYGSFIILSEGMIFNFQGTVSRFGFLPVWGVALAVTIVYLKTDCLFRMHSFRFLGFFS